AEDGLEVGERLREQAVDRLANEALAVVDRHDDRHGRGHGPILRRLPPRAQPRGTASLTLDERDGDDPGVGERDRVRWAVGAGLAVVAAAIVLWVRLLPPPPA